MALTTSFNALEQLAWRIQQHVRGRLRSSDRPVFVAGISHRTGSTLVQRLLCSAEDCFIWGEGDGASTQILNSHATLQAWSKRHDWANEDLIKWGADAFLANITPDWRRIHTAHQSVFRELYGRDPGGQQVRRWGYKEVRHRQIHLTELLQLFPGAQVVAVGRELAGVVASLSRWQEDPEVDWRNEWTLGAVRNWVQNAVDFSAIEDDRIFLLRYEELLAAPEQVLRQLETNLGFAQNSIDRSILSVRVHGDGEAGRRTARPASGLPSSGLTALLVEPATTAAVEHYKLCWPTRV